jgi:hypothetical protein
VPTATLASVFRAGTVVDITSTKYPTPAGPIVVDANVLYLINYPDFDSLSGAGFPTPQAQRVAKYADYIGALLKKDVVLLATPWGLMEFARCCEYAGLQLAWVFANSSAQTFPKNVKEARWQCHADFPQVQQSVAVLLRSVLSTVRTIADPDIDGVIGAWSGTMADLPDAALVGATQAAHRTGAVPTPAVLSDDKDLATCPGITLYTANREVIDAARALKRLQ